MQDIMIAYTCTALLIKLGQLKWPRLSSTSLCSRRHEHVIDGLHSPALAPRSLAAKQYIPMNGGSVSSDGVICLAT